MLLRKGEFQLLPEIFLNTNSYGIAPGIQWLGLELYWGKHAREWKQRLKANKERVSNMDMDKEAMDNLDLVIRHVHDEMYLEEFIRESNVIENIRRDPTKEEVQEHKRFLALKKITVDDLKKFVSVVAPGNVIRDEEGSEAWIGGKRAPADGDQIPRRLNVILENMELTGLGSWETHLEYERLHPFTDGNGRSGRALWLWQRKKLTGKIPGMSFLRRYYYQTLAHAK